MLGLKIKILEKMLESLEGGGGGGLRTLSVIVKQDRLPTSGLLFIHYY